MSLHAPKAGDTAKLASVASVAKVVSVTKSRKPTAQEMAEAYDKNSYIRLDVANRLEMNANLTAADKALVAANRVIARQLASQALAYYPLNTNLHAIQRLGVDFGFT